MKSSRTLIALALLLATSNAWAAELPGTGFDQIYLGIRGGVAHTNMDSANLTSNLRQRGQNVTATVDDQDPFGSAYLGYRFMPNAAVELGYIHAGKYQAKISGSPTSPQKLADEVADLTAGSGNGIALDLRLDVPLVQSVDVTPRFGAYVWKTDFETNSGGNSTKHTKSGVGGHLGFGLTVKLPAHFRLGLGYDVMIPTASHTIGAGYAQLEYGFGEVFP